MAQSMLDPEIMCKQLPPQLERALDYYPKKFPQAAEFFTDIALKTGSPNFMEDAAAFSRISEQLVDLVKKMCGTEGDTTEGDGTLWGAVEATRKTANAMGGEY